MSKLNLVFAGTPEFGLPCLNALHHSDHSIQAIYTQPDRPAGRGRKLQASAVKIWAETHDIPIYQPLNFKTPESIAALEALKPDVMVVIAYGLLLPKAILEIPRLGCINVHASLLPRWRGASPIQQAILHGDSHSGLTIMQMDVGMDTGDMLCTKNCSIHAQDTAGTLHDNLAESAVEPLLDTLKALAHGSAQPIKQNNAEATYAGKIHKEDAFIPWEAPAITIDRMIRAYNPWPIAYTCLKQEVIRIYDAQIIDRVYSETPGTIIQLDKKGMLISTGTNALLITQIQFPGAKKMTIADWLNSGKTQLKVGVVLG